jgi:AraC-like DNA-binding protein
MMKARKPQTRFAVWRRENLFNIDFAQYTLSHHHFPRHFHDHYVIEFVMNGVDEYYCDGKQYRATNNQLVLINPGEVHTGATVSDSTLEYFSLYPDTQALQELASTLGLAISRDFCFHQALDDRPLLIDKFARLAQLFLKQEDSLQQEQAFFDTMECLLSGSSPAEHTSGSHYPDKRVTSLTEYIRAHFSEDITLRTLAGIVNLDPYHVLRIFKHSLGLTPYDYLLALRTEKARQQLRKGHKVQDVAQACGFYDASHLNRAFYKITAVSPKMFRLSKSQDRTIFPA